MELLIQSGRSGSLDTFLSISLWSVLTLFVGVFKGLMTQENFSNYPRGFWELAKPVVAVENKAN